MNDVAVKINFLIIRSNLVFSNYSIKNLVCLRDFLCISSVFAQLNDFALHMIHYCSCLEERLKGLALIVAWLKKS